MDDIWIEPSRYSLLKILDSHTACETIECIPNVLIDKSWIVHNFLYMTRFFRLYYEMGLPTTSDKHSQLNLEEILVAFFKAKLLVEECTFQSVWRLKVIFMQ